MFYRLPDFYIEVIYFNFNLVVEIKPSGGGVTLFIRAKTRRDGVSTAEMKR